MEQTKTIREKVCKLALKILEEKKEGIFYSDLVEAIREALQDRVNVNTIRGALHYFRNEVVKSENSEVLNPDRGFYILKKYYQAQVPEAEEVRKTVPETEEQRKVVESDFYEPFANYLRDELQECTKTLVLGNHQFGDKWGTPDIIGVYRVSTIARLQPLPEIVSAEIKVDKSQILTAFGQACAYKLFSHKVYLVVPRESKDESRLESLCYRFGIGLVVFDIEDMNKPNFTLKMRAIKGEPDYFYLNEYLDRLSRDQLRTLFD